MHSPKCHIEDSELYLPYGKYMVNRSVGWIIPIIRHLCNYCQFSWGAGVGGELWVHPDKFMLYIGAIDDCDDSHMWALYVWMSVWSQMQICYIVCGYHKDTLVWNISRNYRMDIEILVPKVRCTQEGNFTTISLHYIYTIHLPMRQKQSCRNVEQLYNWYTKSTDQGAWSME